jgi:hypothetical protein
MGTFLLEESPKFYTGISLCKPAFSSCPETHPSYTSVFHWGLLNLDSSCVFKRLTTDKGKVVPEGIRGVDMPPLILTSALTKLSGQPHVPAALPLWKKPRYPLNRRLRGPQSRSGRFGGGGVFPIPWSENRFAQPAALSNSCKSSFLVVGSSCCV